MKNKFLQYTLLCCSLVVLFSACRKDPFNGKETKESGKTFVYIEQAQVNNQFFDVFTDIKPVTMFTVRRDAASKADLQKSATVTLKAMDQAYIDASNTKNGTDYTLLPSSIYTLGAQPGVAIGANTDLTLSFAAGDFAKNIIFNIDGSKVDLSKQYAVAYVITNFGGFSKEHTASGVSQDTILATVAIKNRWDGVYTATCDFTGKTNAAFTDINAYLATKGQAPMQYELRTTSATTCIVYDNYVIGGVYVPVSTDAAGSGATYFGNFGLILTFDPATNKITDITNYWGQGTNSQGRSAGMDPGAVNAYDPGTKTMVFTAWMFQPSVVPVGPRNIYGMTLTYIKSR